MHEHAHLRQLIDEIGNSNCLVCLEILSGNRKQCLVGPAVKPVDGATVDDRGELTASVSQFLTDWREGEHDMQVLSCFLVEQLHQVLPSVHDLLLFLARQGPHLVQDLIIILRTPHVGHLSSIQDVVQILEETLLDNLCV